VIGKGVSDFDQTEPQPVSKLGYWACRSSNALRDLGAGSALIGKVSNVMASVNVELPGAAIHGGLLHGLTTDR
jgi:hypothetical protein